MPVINEDIRGTKIRDEPIEWGRRLGDRATREDAQGQIVVPADVLQDALPQPFGDGGPQSRICLITPGRVIAVENWNPLLLLS